MVVIGKTLLNVRISQQTMIAKREYEHSIRYKTFRHGRYDQRLWGAMFRLPRENFSI